MSIQSEQWQTGFCDCFKDGFNFFLGCCVPHIGLAVAKSRFDGSDFWFNCCCFCHAPILIRNYIRQGYGIQGRLGIDDYCTTCCCIHCTACQTLNEVDARGPQIVSVQNEVDGPWIAPEKDYTCVGDPVDYYCIKLHHHNELSALYTQLMGVPFWFSHGITICQIKNITRKVYGIGGNDWYDDCWLPCVWGCLCPGPYAYKSIAKIRAEILYRGPPEIVKKRLPAAALAAYGRPGGGSPLYSQPVPVAPVATYGQHPSAVPQYAVLEVVKQE